MSLALDRPEFAPPPQRGTPRAVLLALVAHALLIAALTWGVRWRSEADEGAVDAELWSSTVQQAAPRLSVPEPPQPTPTPPPPAPPAPPPPPPPPPQVKAPEPAPAPKAPDIALEREKKLKEQKEQKERELERQRQEQRKKELEAKQRAEEEAERKQEQQKKLAEQKKRQEAEAKLAEAKKAEAKQAEAKKAEAAAKQAAADRAAVLKRMQGLAGATGGDEAQGNALRSSGPSSGYAGRIAAAVRPNITFPEADTVSGNPAAEFEVKLAPDGTIVGVRLTKSSGLQSWDEAAERGLHKTDKLPRDTDGRIFPSLIVSLRPKR